MNIVPWIIALVAVALLGAGAVGWSMLKVRQQAKPPPLPDKWKLVARPVFSADERRLDKLLREALPGHILLCKLPLVRFCQPTDPGEAGYWYGLLNTTRVSFAVCSASGRVLAAVDLESGSRVSRRALRIKQAVLATCRVLYLRWPAGHVPSAEDIELLVPGVGAQKRQKAQASGSLRHLDGARDSLAQALAARRREPTSQWHDSTVVPDSMFAPDSRRDSTIFGPSNFASAFGSSVSGRPPPEGGGVVDDSPRPPRSRY